MTEWAKKHRPRVRAYDRRIYAQNSEAVRAAKARPCADCGIQYPHYVMDFDHRDPTKKLFNISGGALRRKPSLILAEIAKCDIVCANCHRERSWWQVWRRQVK